METDQKSFRTFEDLEAYQVARFTLQARGSLQELMDDLNVCDDERYLLSDEVRNYKPEGWRVYQLLNGYIRYFRNRKAGASLALQESSPAYGLTEDQIDEALASTPLPGLTV